MEEDEKDKILDLPQIHIISAWHEKCKPYNHESVNHSVGEYVRELDMIDQMAFLAKGMVGKSLPYKVLVNRKPS